MLADHAVVAEGKIYVNGGGITRINVPVLPFAVPMLSMVLRYMIEGPGDRAAHTLEMQFETPSGISLFPEASIDVVIPESANRAPGEEEYAQTLVTMGGVPIIETGIHKYSVWWDGELVRAFALPVVLTEGVEAPAPQPNRAERRRQQRAG